MYVEMANLPIIDAHHHFWNLSLNKNPWLNPSNQIPFRYGNYESICKNFLIEDFRYPLYQKKYLRN